MKIVLSLVNIDGQEFRFTDFAFGLNYKITQDGNKWKGNKGYIRTPLMTTAKISTKPENICWGEMYIKNNYKNRIIIYSWRF